MDIKPGSTGIGVNKMDSLNYDLFAFEDFELAQYWSDDSNSVKCDIKMRSIICHQVCL